MRDWYFVESKQKLYELLTLVLVAELGNLIDYDEDRVTARHRTGMYSAIGVEILFCYLLSSFLFLERTSGRVPSVKEVIRPIEKCHSGRVGPEVLDIATDVDDE